MSGKTKNIVIVILILVIIILIWMLHIQSYGRYCKPIVKEMPYHENSLMNDSLLKK